jgi:uncharacterized membrane protein YkoI
MKTIFASLLALFTGSSFISCAQDMDQAHVPSVVLNTFQTSFPDATDTEWEKKGDTYEVEFDMSRQEYKAYLDASGKLLLTRYELSQRDLPEAVSKTIQADFKEYRLDDVEAIEQEGETFYEVELESKTLDRKVMFTQDGQVTDKVYSKQ